MIKTAILFPGQGSQCVGMGSTLYQRSSIARQTFEEANDVLGFDIKGLCFEGNIEELTETQNAQPAILTVSIAAFRTYMQEIGLEPAYLAGHSLGEISALVASDAISFSDGLKIIRKRGYLMKEAGVKAPGTMAAVSGVSQEALQEICRKASQDGKIVVLSNINSKDQIVISGHKETVEKTCDLLVSEGGTATFLKVSAAFHSPLMNQASSDFSEELVKYNYNPMKRTVISNVTALPYESEREIISKLKLQIISPVMWKQSMEYLRDKGVEVAVEMQPKTILKNLMRKNAPEIKTYSFDRNDDVQSLKEFILLKNKEKNNKTSNKSTVVERCLSIAVCTRNQNWDDEEYTAGVIVPYKQIQSMKEKIESENREPTYDEMMSALNMLKSVFKTKKVPSIEQTERFEQIFKETGTAELFFDFSIL